MSKDKDEDFDMFKLGFDEIVAQADRYLAEKEKERKNNG